MSVETAAIPAWQESSKAGKVFIQGEPHLLPSLCADPCAFPRCGQLGSITVLWPWGDGIPVHHEKKTKNLFSSPFSVCPCEFNPGSPVSDLLSQPSEVLPQGCP